MYTVDCVALQSAIHDKGFLQSADLARKAKIDPIKLERILSGAEFPTVHVMYLLKKALDLSPQTASSIFFSDNLRNT